MVWFMVIECYYLLLLSSALSSMMTVGMAAAVPPTPLTAISSL
jgi:hypothetical protein